MMAPPPFENLPANSFGAILADPPWGFQCWDGKDKKVASRGSVNTPINHPPVDRDSAWDAMWKPPFKKAVE